MNLPTRTANVPLARRRGLRLAVYLLGGALLTPIGARAQSPSANSSPTQDGSPPVPAAKHRALKLNEQGATHFDAGRYRQAIESFVEAHATQPDSNLLFNIAACYERLGEPKAAIEKYELFLRAPDGAPEGKPAASAAIERLRRELESTQSSSAEQPLLVPPAQNETPPPAPSQLAREVPTPEDSPTPSWIPWTALGTGGVLLAAGGIAYALGAQDHQKVRNARGYNQPETVSSLTRQQASDWVDSGNTKKALGVGALVAGVGALSGYASWYFWRATQDSAAVSIGGPQSATFVSVSGAF